MKSSHMIFTFHFISFCFGGSLLTDDLKKKRSFSIFSVVQFSNTQCFAPTLPPAVQTRGTCFTSTECLATGGSGGGSCASGFGICCLYTFTSCGSEVNKNTSYIQNPGYPSAFLNANATACAYTISSTSDICQIRLDFDNLVLGNPDILNNTTITTPTRDTTSGKCYSKETMTIISSSGSGPNASPPVVCGTLTGQHMYIETGRTNTTAATISFASGGQGKIWKIRVTQLECNNPARAPSDCLQFFTGPAGTFKSFNYQNGIIGTGQMLQGLSYSICFRQEEGYCGIQYSEADISGTARAFNLDNDFAATITTTITKVSAQGTEKCNFYEVSIPSSNPAVSSDTFCGTFFNEVVGQNKSGTITSYFLPFYFGVFSTTTATKMGVTSVGFNLIFNQVPC